MDINKLVDAAMTKIRAEQARTNDIGDYGKLESIIKSVIADAVSGNSVAYNLGYEAGLHASGGGVSHDESVTQVSRCVK